MWRALREWVAARNRPVQVISEADLAVAQIQGKRVAKVAAALKSLRV